ncbi:1-acyl-sn-glycerol-3-phosphate acyltransferase [Cyanobium sp. CH-040]|uniref:1-acyl-sn-glycerol-3-phosphate acyltransferase n=1 Tax=Cyanobium sp. CH-040 TaxID=2823708 RepID=UPI0020CC8286|nr:1-acyl-sn-glycerol-3-phosphate acyltransferase [Cyanobium sp. CH-040]MCP9926376.1 1-acyl-sn-glycerol-3-phosphate acyltransferase [Cyanobium sp. CH-040]
MAAQRTARVQPPLAPIPPAYRPEVLRLVYALLPLLLRWRLVGWLPAGITRLELVNGAPLFHLLEQFRQGRCRLLLAFRHSAVDDPLCGLWLFSRGLPPALRPQPVHFLYDRGMPLWAGRPLGWLLSRLGGVSLRRGRHPDWSALRQARALMRDGPFPFAVAPEGATNGLGHGLGPLEPGSARLALWCRDDLRRAGRAETVWIVPIGIQYRYPDAPWPRLERLLGRLERQMGLPPLPLPPLPRPPSSAAAGASGFPGADPLPERCRQRLLRLGEHLLSALEGFYGRFGEGEGERSGEGERTGEGDGRPRRADQADHCDGRIAGLQDRVLRLAEARLAVRAAGTAPDRCRRLEEVAWRWIHREDLPPRRRLAPLQRFLADRAAAEASLALQHMRLVETFVAVSGGYLGRPGDGSAGGGPPEFERCADIALLLHDGLARLSGGALPARPRLGRRHARLVVAEPIRVDEPLPANPAADGPTRRQVEGLSAQLEERLRGCLP